MKILNKKSLLLIAGIMIALVFIPVSRVFAIEIEDEQKVNSVDITMKLPDVGTQMTVESYMQTPKITATAPSGAKYSVQAIGVEEAIPTGDEVYYEGKIQANTYYYVEMYVEMTPANWGQYFFTSDTVIKVNGSTEGITLAPYYVTAFANGEPSGGIKFYAKLKSGSATTTYKIVEGANQKHEVEGGKDLVVKADGDFTKFTGIKVDGTTVSASNYTAVSGSTKVTLKSAYLDTLTAGTHKLTFVYNDGEVSTNFTVAKAATTTETTTTESETTTTADTTTAETTATTTSSDTTNTTVKTKNPPTGDNVLVYVGLLIISVVGSAITIKKIIK